MARPDDAEYKAPPDAEPKTTSQMPLFSILSSPCGSCAVVGSDDEQDQNDEERTVEFWDVAPPGCLSVCGTGGNISANPPEYDYDHSMDLVFRVVPVVEHEDATAHPEATADPLPTASELPLAAVGPVIGAGPTAPHETARPPASRALRFAETGEETTRVGARDKVATAVAAYSELEAARAAQQLAQQRLTDAERWLVECAAECGSVCAMDDVEGTGAAADGAAANGAAANGAAANGAAANGAARMMHTRCSSPKGITPTAGDARRAAASAAAGAAADTADDDAICGAESVQEVCFTEV